LGCPRAFRIFQTPPSRTSTPVQNPFMSMGAPDELFPVMWYSNERNSPGSKPTTCLRNSKTTRWPMERRPAIGTTPGSHGWISRSNSLHPKRCGIRVSDRHHRHQRHYSRRRSTMRQGASTGLLRTSSRLGTYPHQGQFDCGSIAPLFCRLQRDRMGDGDETARNHRYGRPTRPPNRALMGT
jgi:hypothetical protein